MINENNLQLIGTSHVSADSKAKIKSIFAEFKPDIICIELDAARFAALTNPDKKRGKPSIRQLGVTGYVFAIIGHALQKKMGNITGMTPGEEMMLGATLAKNNKLKLELIDQDASTTLRNMSKKVKFSEKLKIVLDIFKAPFSKKMRLQIDITKIPDDEVIFTLLKLMKNRYPGFYRVLLDDRNRFMAKKIYFLMKANPEKKVMAIVGAGHIEGMKKHLKLLMDSNVY
ncbi:MAG: TraB domain-containing protein [Candidatus Woesearchaeota archaeon]|jgi:pheromone shutdown-related protein TraB